ncbi:patatin-like phospholipase RssA [Shewanella sp. JM162201]|uniref:Patatin-like phospholipase RssA n=1 Tax=Shewanella jiangmenensis TaxID=2837387 RepID=A0ABS5UZV8_9GAMM|nr:patatin-like phospholipase RssA [Shewanella jiangmenensis]MBT1443150.1 patatin-like phospholipase RssA [Shewanella jiangmenensis]
MTGHKGYAGQTGAVRVGVALGSGAAKGWAHIGVLNALLELDVKPERVAGCSIGALVGAAYANGQLESLEAWVRSFSSWDVLGMMDLSWRRGGLIRGEKVFDIMQSHIGDVEIESMPMPFIAVATDLYSAQEVWFRQGDLRHAVRASCSMPGILPPVRQGHRWLVDGAVVNPVPVSACRALEVDLVIAVDLDGHRRSRIQSLPVDLRSEALTPQEERRALAAQEGGFMDLFARGRDYIASLSDKFSLGSSNDPGMLAVMTQSMEIVQQRHKRARLMGDPPDVCIVPRVGDIGTMEFHRAAEAIDAGYRAVMDNAHLIDAMLGRSEAPAHDKHAKRGTQIRADGNKARGDGTQARGDREKSPAPATKPAAT